MKKRVYIKDQGFDPLYKTTDGNQILKTKVIPTLFMLSGIFVLLYQVVLPLLALTTQKYTTDEVTNTVLGKATGFSKFEFSELNSFDRENTTAVSNIPKYFYITIPKLNIKKAKVEIDAKTLDPNEALGHYKGTALPGQVGTSFVYGHSVLPWFYNPQNYKTIFSKLDTLDIGDSFFVDYDNKIYVYKVESKTKVSPKKVNPLAEIKPKYLNESTMVLMTCSPPGTNLKRLLVSAVRIG